MELSQKNDESLRKTDVHQTIQEQETSGDIPNTEENVITSESTKTKSNETQNETNQPCAETQETKEGHFDDVVKSMPEMDLNAQASRMITPEATTSDSKDTTDEAAKSSNNTKQNLLKNQENMMGGKAFELDVKQLQKDILDKNNRIDSLKKEVDGLREIVEKLTSFVTNEINIKIEKTAGMTESAVGTLSKRMTELEEMPKEKEKILQLSQNVDGFWGRMNEAEQKMSSLQASQDMLKDISVKLEKTEQTFSKKIDGVESALLSRISDIEQQFSSAQMIIAGLLKDGLSKLEKTRETKWERFIGRAKEKEQKNIQEEQARLASFSEDARYWEEQGKQLHSKIMSLKDSIANAIAVSRKIFEKLPGKLQSELQSNQEGLSLIGKMLERKISQPADLEKLRELASAIDFTESVNAVPEDEWKLLIEEGATEEVIRKKIEKKLNAMSMQNYQTVSKLGDLAEKRKKKFLGFVETSILPMIDGIRDGQKYATDRINKLQIGSPISEEVQRWFETYSALYREFMNFLDKIKVRRMEVKLGAAIDYALHEPFGTEPDASLPNEHIKEISRDGYEYASQDSKSYVLRPAQVIVVKNKN